MTCTSASSTPPRRRPASRSAGAFLTASTRRCPSRSARDCRAAATRRPEVPGGALAAHADLLITKDRALLYFARRRSRALPFRIVTPQAFGR